MVLILCKNDDNKFKRNGMAEVIFGANQGLGNLVNVTATLIAYDLVLINLSREKMGAIT